MSENIQWYYKAPQIIGMYVNDDNLVVNSESIVFNSVSNDKLRHYIPIIENIGFNCVNFKLVNEKSYSKTIEFNEKFNEFAKLTDKPYVRMTKEILPMSFHQALCSDVTILLNLTNKNVYTRDHVGNVRVYPPVLVKDLNHYEGKVLFIQLKLYDHKDYVQEHTSIKDYMLSYIKKYKGRENPKRNFTAQVYEYIIDTINKTDINQKGSFSLTSSTYKVITLLDFDEENFTRKNEVGLTCHNYYIPFVDLVLSCDNHNAIAEHPSVSGVSQLSKEEIQLLSQNSFTCYIVDKENRIDTKYFNFGGKVFKIPKVKVSDREDGLYYRYQGEDGIIEEEHYRLDEIKDIKFIYNTYQEAEHGLDLESKSQIDFEMKKREYDSKKQELELLISQLKAENEKIKAESDLVKSRYERDKYEHKENSDRIAMYASLATAVIASLVLIVKIVK